MFYWCIFNYARFGNHVRRQVVDERNLRILVWTGRLGLTRVSPGLNMSNEYDCTYRGNIFDGDVLPRSLVPCYFRELFCPENLFDGIRRS